jgi:hypothetical protein
MNKLKIEHGASRTKRAKLQASIEQTIADDIQVLSDWSNNEPQYVVNQLLRFALAQEEGFQKYKASLTTTTAKTVHSSKSEPAHTRTVPRSESAAASHAEERN